MNGPTHLIAIAAAAAVLLGACAEKDQTAPTTTPEGEQQPAPPPDSLGSVGKDAASLVLLWSQTLSVVDTEESAITANQRLKLIAEQFDDLIDRAVKLPKLSATEFKRIDAETDSLISIAASGLEKERRRIFVLPDEIKRHVLPDHEQLMEKFRSMNRSISQTR